MGVRRSPGPPPCRRLPFDPLPLARLVVGWGRGELHGARLPGPEYLDRIRTWVYAGISLTWTFKPIETAACAASQARWHETLGDRRRKIGALAVAWERAARAVATADEVGAAVAARVELERVEAMIGSASGMPLTTKETQ